MGVFTGDRIPAEMILPFIEEAIAEIERDRQCNPWMTTFAPLESVAFRVGMSTRAIHRYRSGESKTISITDADKILCGLGMVHRWYMEPLLSHYERCINPESKYQHQVAA